MKEKNSKKEYIKSMEEVEKLVGEKNLPSFTASILPIIIPIVLILLKHSGDCLEQVKEWQTQSSVL